MAPPKTADQERAARLRAARGYSGLDQRALAAKLGISLTTLSRMENAKTRVPDEDAYRYVEACGVPRWFIEHGFSAPAVPEEPTLAERIEALEGQVATLTRLAADALRQPPGELGQAAQGSRPREAHQQQDDLTSAGGSRRGSGAR